MTSRDLNIDLLRLSAAVLVIVIHVPFDTSAASSIDLWCVPVFFLLSGYFLKGAELRDAIEWRSIIRVSVITLSASCIYLPLYFLADGALSARLLMTGFWIHLWFLHALIFGLIFTKLYFTYVGSKVFFAVFAVVIILALHAVDWQVSFQNEGTTLTLVVLRFLQAGPLIFLGLVIRQNGLTMNKFNSWVCIGCGALLCLGEAVLLQRAGAGVINPQFPLGTLPMMLGLFFLFKNLTVQTFVPRYIDVGKCALMIYILHPFVLTVIKHGSNAVFASPNILLGLHLTLGIMLSLLAPIIIERIFPPLDQFLSGAWVKPRLQR